VRGASSRKKKKKIKKRKSLLEVEGARKTQRLLRQAVKLAVIFILHLQNNSYVVVNWYRCLF